MSIPCKSGRHFWVDPVSAGRCCAGWHQELRVPGPDPGDDPEGRVTTDEGTFVWVRDEVESTAEAPQEG